MNVTLSTNLQAPADKVWNTVKTKRLLFHVMKPLARFSLINDDESKTWIEGKTYIGWSFLLHIIPVGKRHITIESINEDTLTIQSREHGKILLSKWDHLITIEPVDEQTCVYTDTIEIQASIFTTPYWLFAQIFYRYRQRKWRTLVENDFDY